MYLLVTIQGHVVWKGFLHICISIVPQLTFEHKCIPTLFIAYLGYILVLIYAYLITMSTCYIYLGLLIWHIFMWKKITPNLFYILYSHKNSDIQWHVQEFLAFLWSLENISKRLTRVQKSILKSDNKMPEKIRWVDCRVIYKGINSILVRLLTASQLWEAINNLTNNAVISFITVQVG